MTQPIDVEEPKEVLAESSPFAMMGDVFSAIAHAFSAETDAERRTLFEVVHRTLIIFDDYLCELFGFSRKPRGRYNNKKKERG